MTITLDISIYTILTVSGIFILLKGCVIFWGIALASNNFAKLAKIVDNLAKIVDNLGFRQSKSVQRALSATMITYF